MARYLTGELSFPDHIWRLIAKSGLDPATHNPSDRYVVELSSAKSITLDGWSIQLNYLYGHYPEVFGDVDQARNYWVLVDTGDEAETHAYLRRINASDPDTLSRIKRTFVDEATLRRDMARLIDLLPDVLFVTHVNARQPDGEPLSSRSDFIARVESSASSIGARLHNPTGSMRFVGQQNAIADNSDGMAHYQDGFEAVVANDLGQLLRPDTSLTFVDHEESNRPLQQLLEIAKHRQSDRSATTDALTKLYRQHPKSTAQAAFEHARSSQEIVDRFPDLETHLDENDQHLFWASFGSIKDYKNPPKSDRLTSEVISRLAETGDWRKLDHVLLRLGRPISPMLSHTISEFLKASFTSRRDLLEATKVVLKHIPNNQTARGVHHHIRTWLKAQDVSKADGARLEEIADLNSCLPVPIGIVSMALARRHFELGNDGAVLAIGLPIHEEAPSNLTFLMTLMRAASRSSHAMAEELAQRVVTLGRGRDNLVKEAAQILDAQNAEV